jgi:tRNA (guanine37-N1)-methyltransferase
MKIALVTLFPDMFTAVSEHGVSGRAIRDGLVELGFFNPRDYSTDKHRTVDDRPYGGGPGMVMRCEPLTEAVKAARQWMDAETATRVIYLSPQGRVLNQSGVQEMATLNQIILVAGRYEGVDERFIEREIDEEISIGDYVVSGGELPAMVMMDAMIRCLPGALGHEESAGQDSFSEGMLDWPHYTRPEEFAGMGVPEVLLSGDHARIAKWREQQAHERTRQRRPDLLDNVGKQGKDKT